MGSVAVQVGKVEVLLDDRDRICGHIKAGKMFEPHTLQRFANAVEAGTIVIDIGCYSGLFSIAAAKMGAIPVGFEPYPPNQDQITRNMALNMTDFDLRRMAVSDRDGIARLGYNEKVTLTAGASLERKSGQALTVSKTRLDSLTWDERISVIKIDVERHEPAVLRGAMNTILTHKPTLIVEALDEGLKRECLNLLPRYHLEAVLDVRNLVLVPNN